MNTYGYVGGNPIRKIDLFGLKDYLVVVGTGTGGFGPLAGEAGTIFIIDPCTFDIYTFLYLGGGGGIGFGGAVTLEGGVLSAGDPMDITGWGMQTGGFAAAGPGGAVSIPFGSNDAGDAYTGIAGGIAGGGGAGVSGMLTYTWHDNTYRFDNAPDFLKDILEPIKPDCSCEPAKSLFDR